MSVPGNPFVGRFLGEANLIEGAVMAKAAKSSGYGCPPAWSCAPHPNSCVAGRGMLFHPARAVRDRSGHGRVRRPGVNALAGNARRCSFLGNILRYAVDLEGIAPITVDLQNPAGVAPLPV